MIIAVVILLARKVLATCYAFKGLNERPYLEEDVFPLELFGRAQEVHEHYKVKMLICCMFGHKSSVEIDEDFCFGAKVELVLISGVQVLT